jgi:hypothetical protein
LKSRKSLGTHTHKCKCAKTEICREPSSGIGRSPAIRDINFSQRAALITGRGSNNAAGVYNFAEIIIHPLVRAAGKVKVSEKQTGYVGEREIKNLNFFLAGARAAGNEFCIFNFTCKHAAGFPIPIHKVYVRVCI